MVVTKIEIEIPEVDVDSGAARAHFYEGSMALASGFGFARQADGTVIGIYPQKSGEKACSVRQISAAL